MDTLTSLNHFHKYQKCAKRFYVISSTIRLIWQLTLPMHKVGRKTFVPHHCVHSASLLERGGQICDFYRPHPKNGGRKCFDTLLSVCLFTGCTCPPAYGWGSAYLPVDRNGTYLDKRKGYLPWLPWGVPTFEMMGEGTYFPGDGGTYLPADGEGIPTLDRGILTSDGGTYPGGVSPRPGP